MSQPSNQQTIICITFDDADASIYENAFPILNEFGYAATNFVPSSWLGQVNKLSWEQVEEMEFEYGWETGGHTLNHEDLGLLSYEQADATIRLDQMNLLNHGLAAESFALPGGHCPDVYFPIIQNYYQNIRISQDLPLYQPIDRFALGYCPFESSFNGQDIIDRIVRGIANHEALIIIGFHSIGTVSDGFPTNCTPNEFRSILTWIHEHNMPVKTLDKAVNYFELEKK
jgi:peptidoglycan/xylan/chitin deacetylase (PgdA/CDA1 family)